MTKLSLLITLGLCFGLHIPGCSVSTPFPDDDPPVQDAFQQRKDALLDGMALAHGTEALRGKFAFWQAQALFATERTEDALQILETTLQTHLNDHQGNVFVAWAMADTYLRWQHLLPEATKKQFEQQLTTYAGYDSGSTENHRLMLATARLLADQAWPDASFRSNFRQEDPTGRMFLLNRMNKYVHTGTVEFDSPAYHAFYIGTMRSLADLAQDADLRQKAVLTAEWLVLENAGEWLDGYWLSASLRHKSYDEDRNEFRPSDYVLWLYFAASFPPDFADERAVFAAQAAVSTYRLPASVVVAATDRARAFVHRETDVWAGRHYYKTTYLNRTYGLYSVMEDYKVHTAFSEQYHRWAAEWLSDARKNTLYVKHPHQTTGEEGTTGYEQVLQHEGTLLAVYVLPEAYPGRWVRLRTPAGYEAVIDESEAGDVFFHYGTVLIALRLSEPFAWDAVGDAHDHPAGRLGVVIETALPDAYSGSAAQQLMAFKQAVQQHALDFSVTGDRPTLGYTDAQGVALSITFDGARSVNGAVMDVTAWPLLEDPWMQQAVEGDRLVVETPEQRITYDFGSWTKQ